MPSRRVGGVGQTPRCAKPSNARPRVPPSPPLLQTALLKDYRHLVVFCIQFGDTFVDAVANLEKRLGSAFSMTLLRDLRGLATPESREKVLPVMASDAVTAKTFRKVVDDAITNLWIDWHWTMAPDTLIHPTKRMPLHRACVPWYPLPRDHTANSTPPPSSHGSPRSG